MITGNEPAMPKVKTDEAHTNRNINGPSYGNTYSTGGLTIRQHFAAMSMQGLCANSVPGKHHEFSFCASEAVKYADALIAELNK